MVWTINICPQSVRLSLGGIIITNLGDPLPTQYTGKGSLLSFPLIAVHKIDASTKEIYICSYLAIHYYPSSFIYISIYEYIYITLSIYLSIYIPSTMASVLVAFFSFLWLLLSFFFAFFFDFFFFILKNLIVISFQCNYAKLREISRITRNYAKLR